MFELIFAFVYFIFTWGLLERAPEGLTFCIFEQHFLKEVTSLCVCVCSRNT